MYHVFYVAECSPRRIEFKTEVDMLNWCVSFNERWGHNPDYWVDHIVKGEVYYVWS